ncbi:MAG: hypothetical protein IJW47_02135, partial [Clostridia bacterium]|nr:hypothetical protein [Clostridia bacterium]
GFRGEALASISAVSKTEITSRHEDDMGGFCKCYAGDISPTLPITTEVGTIVSVRDLFFNTPVRAKFLKQPKAEEADISNIVARLMLANPFISFTYTVNGRVVYQTFGDGLESAMINVYGYSIVNNCFYIETVKNGMSIKGYIGKHNYVKSNRTYQTLIVNGRYVLNNTINSAITNAYSSYLMKRQYPFFVLKVNLPADFVDVNVHPNKTEVRFQNNQVVYGSIYSVISSVLDGTNKALDIVKIDLNKDEEELKTVREEIREAAPNEKATVGTIQKFLTPYKQSASTRKANVKSESENSEIKVTKEQLDIFAQNKAYIEKLEKSKINQEKIEIEDPLVYIGQAFNTFLIYQKADDLYIVDQHAAHERLLYDKMLGYSEATLILQPLLVPIRIKPNPLEEKVLDEIIQYVRTIGIEMERGLDGTYTVSVLPIELVDIDFDKFLQEMVDEYALYNKKLPSVVLEKIMQKACKSAIKAGDKLTRVEIDKLTVMLNEDFGLKCPHGRPIAVKITKHEIYKWFKRIV